MNVDVFSTNGTTVLTWDDSIWILHLSFIIFTMQTGFGLLEIGCARMKNEVNIMMKNTMDIIFGGLSYWMVGYGFSYGRGQWSNSFIGLGDFFVSTTPDEDQGSYYANFVSQFSYATTARTIVSGAVAERMKLGSYIIFSFFNTFIYCVSVHWIWSPVGFLYQLGAIDASGSGPLHLLGGSCALISAILIGPRIGRFDSDITSEINPTNTLVGLFMLWWGWLAFNASCLTGISEGKWVLVTKAVVNTLNSSIGAGISGILITLIETGGKYKVSTFVSSVLSGLVAISAGCTVIETWEAIIIGFIASFIVYFGAKVILWLRIDDPIGATAVHGFGGMWGLLSVGLFCDIDPYRNQSRNNIGLFHGGGFKSLGLQTLTCICLIAWGFATTFIILGLIKFFVGIRLTPHDELVGADISEHDVGEESPLNLELLEIYNVQFRRRRFSGILTKESRFKKLFDKIFRKIYKTSNIIRPPSVDGKIDQHRNSDSNRRSSMGSYKVVKLNKSSVISKKSISLADAEPMKSSLSVVMHI